MLRALRTVTPEVSAFEQARVRWEAVRRERQELKARIAGARAALGFAESPPNQGDVVSPVLAEKAQAYLGGRKPNAERLRREIEDLADEQAQAAERYGREAEVWRTALADEARRRAEAVQPKLKALVRALARSVQRVSDDVEALRSLQGQLAEVGEVASLPDLGLEIFGTLSEFNSPVSNWNRRVLQSGALDP